MTANNSKKTKRQSYKGKQLNLFEPVQLELFNMDDIQPKPSANEIKPTNRVQKSRSAYYLNEEFIKPAIKQALDAQTKAKKALAKLDAEEKRLTKLADDALEKYPLL